MIKKYLFICLDPAVLPQICSVPTGNMKHHLVLMFPPQVGFHAFHGHGGGIKAFQPPDWKQSPQFVVGSGSWGRVPVASELEFQHCHAPFIHIAPIVISDDHAVPHFKGDLFSCPQIRDTLRLVSACFKQRIFFCGFFRD